MARFDYLNNYLNSNTNKYQGGGMLTQYNVGGTHEQNPNGGIPLGDEASVEQDENSINVGPEGEPQERPTGSKYIFSNRQMWTKADQKAAGLPIFGDMTASEYTDKMFGKYKGREGDLAAKETIKTFTQRAQQLAETKRMAEELALNQAMLANSQQMQVAPENEVVPEGMEEFAGQPQEQIAQQETPMQAGPQDQMMAAQGGYFTRRRYDNGGTAPSTDYQAYFRNLASNAGNAPDTATDFKFGDVVGATTSLGGTSDTASAGLGSEKAGLKSDAAGPGAGAYAQAAITGYDLFQKAESGGTSRDMGTAVATGALSGAAAGAMFGPWGAAVGGVVGGVAGGIGAKKAEKNFWKETNKAVAAANAGMPNSSAWEGTAGSGTASARGGYIGRQGVVNIRPRPGQYKMGGKMCATGGFLNNYASGGGLTGKDRGTGNKAYPMVSSDDFAGGDRSYPIPTIADAIDALRLAGLHGRSDVRSKVFSKYPSLKKAMGGHIYAIGGGVYPGPIGNEGLPLRPWDPLAYSTRNQEPYTPKSEDQTQGYYRDQMEQGNPLDMDKRDLDRVPTRINDWYMHGTTGIDPTGGRLTSTAPEKRLPLISNMQYDTGAPNPLPAGSFTPKLPGVLMNAPMAGQESNLIKNLQDVIKIPSTAEGYGTAWGKRSDKALYEHRLKNEPGFAKKIADWKKANPGADPVSSWTKDELNEALPEPSNNNELQKLGTDWRTSTGLTKEGYTQWNPTPETMPESIENPAYTHQQYADNYKNAEFLRFVQDTKGEDAAAKAAKDLEDKNKKERKDKFKDFIDRNASDITRAYPILSNIEQRGALNRPTGTRYARLGDAYNVPQIDEARVMRDANAAYANQNRALTQMGGSQAGMRASLLGAGALDIQRRGSLQEGLADAQLNRAMQEQQFKNQIAQYNAQAGDREIETWAKDIGNYETQKSKLTGQIGTDIGLVGKEQTHMKQVAAMYGYDWNGRYLINRETGKPATQAELSTMRQTAQATAAADEKTTTTKPTQMNTVAGLTGTVLGRMGGYITRRKSRY